jgi:hypothetical protein
MSNCPYCDPAVEKFLMALKKKQYAEDLQEAMIRMKKRHSEALEKQALKKKNSIYQLY